MFTSLLYHTFEGRGYVYEASKYQGGRILFRVQRNPKQLRYPECKSSN